MMLRARSCAAEGSSPAATACRLSVARVVGTDAAELDVAAGGEVDAAVTEAAGQAGEGAQRRKR